MARKKYYIGSLGPFFYDDAVLIDDPDGDFIGMDNHALVTDGQQYIATAPTLDQNVVRLHDLNTKFRAIATTNIGNPTELNALTGTVNMIVVVIQPLTPTIADVATVYIYDPSGPAVSAPYVMDAAGSGSERWIAIAGRYSRVSQASEVYTASRLLATDANKFVSTIDALPYQWPIGSVFLAVVSTNPNTLLGYGTWSQIAQGQMLVGYKSGDADFGTVEGTGGAKTHKHSIDVPSHGHTVKPPATASGVPVEAPVVVQGGTPANVVGTHTHNVDIAQFNSGATNIAPFDSDTVSSLNPYFTVYVWKRTA